MYLSAKGASRSGIGTSLLRTTLKQLWEIGINQVKTLVSRSPHWINAGIYRKHGFQLERTFYQYGNPEPMDLLTLRLDGPQPKITPTVQHLEPKLKNTLPVDVLFFYSAHCPYSSAVYLNHLNAMARFSKELVNFKTVDIWKDQETAKLYGSMLFGTYINGRNPFCGPPKQEDIENEIQKEINRVSKLKQ